MKLIVALLMMGWMVGNALAERTIIISGANRTTVVRQSITLGDVAEVTSKVPQVNDEAIIALKNIVVATAPAPGKSKAIAATDVVHALRAQQVDFEKVGYAFPQAVEVTRAGRTLSVAELAPVIEKALQTSGRDVALREIVMSQAPLVPPTTLALTAAAVGIPQGGRATFSVTARAEDNESLVFPVQAYVEEFAEVPLARRALVKGSMVTPDDIVMARLNLQSIPRDAVRGRSDVLGLEVSQEVPYGDYFRARALNVPLLVQAGQKVSVVTRSGKLEATLQGIALSGGAKGAEVQVRNDSSRKIVRGTVVGERLVEVVQ